MWSSPNIPTVVLTILCELGIGIGPSWGKTFDPCELAQGLANAPGISQDQIADWVCLARYESEYNSSAVGTLNWDGSKDLGIFQISEKYWCEWGKPGKACRQRCEDFLDNDLEDDIKCVRKIHKEHTKLSGNGFNAWVAWKSHCQGDVGRFTKDCPPELEKTTPSSSPNQVSSLMKPGIIAKYPHQRAL